MHMELKNELAVVQSLSHIHLFVTPWTAACQVSLYNFWLMFIKPGMPSNYLISVAPFSSCLQSFPASGSFLMSQLFTSTGQSIEASASASVLLTNIQG